MSDWKEWLYNKRDNTEYPELIDIAPFTIYYEDGDQVVVGEALGEEWTEQIVREHNSFPDLLNVCLDTQTLFGHIEDVLTSEETAILKAIRAAIAKATNPEE